MGAAGWCVSAVLAAALLFLGLLLLRVRMLASRIGAFECALRYRGERRWMSGVACFGGDEMQWYRLVSLSTRPKVRFPRHQMDLMGVQARTHAGHVVDVTCQVGEQRYELGMMEDSHSALVAWLEAAAPRQPRLF